MAFAASVGPRSVQDETVEERQQLACTTLAVNITAFPSKPHVATDGTAQKRKSVVHVRGDLPDSRDPTL